MLDTFKHTEKTIQEGLAKYFWKRGHKISITNFSGSGFAETDFLSITEANYVYSFEIKISKSDFKNDFKHKGHKHKRLKESQTQTNKRGLPNYFYFVTPEKLVDLRSIPEYAGLIYINNNQQIEIIKKAKRLHTKKCDLRFYKRILKTYVERAVFGKSYVGYCIEEKKKAKATKLNQLKP